MSKALDYISLTIIIFVSTFVWCTLFLPGWIYPLLFSAAFTLIIVFSVRYLSGKRNKPYSYDRLALELSVRGSEYLINLLKTALKNKEIESGSNYILLNDCILVAAYKFAPLNISDLSNFVQLAGRLDRTVIYVMARGVDRRAYQALQLQNLKLGVIKIRQIYKFLYRHNALPDLKPQRQKFSFALLWEALFRRSNTKNYIFSGVLLIAIAFLTPLKIYYIVFGSVSLLMALLTLTPLGKGAYYDSKVFEKLESEKSNQISIDELLENKKDDDGPLT